MILYIETSKLTNNDLRVLSTKTAKSVRTLKREKESYTYLGCNVYNGCYRFLSYSVGRAEKTICTPKRFFELIEQEHLLGLLK